MPYPLRFAVNARPLRKPVTGISRYLRELMREVERDDRFAPHYFYSTHWGENLDRAPGQLLSPNLMRLGGLLRAVDPLLRSIERRNFAAGLRGGNFAFYFEPAYLPFRTTLPTVITVHDLSHLRHPETHPAARVRKFERELPAAIEQAAVILTPSEFTRGEVIEVFGVSPERVVATPLGADAAFFPRNRDETAAVLEPLALAHGRYFLAVGTLEPRKNIVTTLDAHSRLPQRVRTAYPLVVAGMSGWLNDAIADDSKRPARAVMSGCLATSARSSCRSCTRERRCWRTRPSTKGSACRRSRPWRAGFPSPFPTAPRCPKSSETPASSSILTTSRA